MTGMTEDHKKSEIVTHRLCLRQFRQEDLEAYARIMGDHEVGNGSPKEPATHAKRPRDHWTASWNTGANTVLEYGQ